MTDRARTGVWLLGPALIGGLGAAVWWPGAAFSVLVGAHTAAHTITIPNASGRRVTLSMAVTGATALLSGGSPVLVLGSYAVALPVGWLIIHVRHGRRVAGEVFPAEPVGTLVFASAFYGAVVLLPSVDPVHPAVLGSFTGAAVLGFIGAASARALLSIQRRVVARRLIGLRALHDWPAYAVVCSSAALFSVTAEPMGAWSLPLAGLPYLFAHMSLHRLQTTRRTYDQTIRALGAIPEAGGQVDAGHSSRTAELAVAVGAEVGLGVTELRRLEYAGLLHDLGRVVLANPAVARTEHSFDDVSRWSAAIIGEVRHLERVAAIVGLQHAPYRKEGEERDHSVPKASQLVRIAARFDSATAAGASPLVAMESLHRGAAYDYDPDLVKALRRVLERRGTVAA